MEEAHLGFVIGVVVGVVVGVRSGQVPFLSDVLSPVHQGGQRDPAHRARRDLHHRLRPRHDVEGRARRRPGVLRASSSTPSRASARSTATSSPTPGSSARRGWQVIRHVVIPSALTWIIASLHVAFGFAIIGAIVGEVLGAQQGLGAGHHRLRRTTSTPNGVFAGMIIIGVIALVAEWLISLLEQRLLAWRPPTADRVRRRLSAATRPSTSFLPVSTRQRSTPCPESLVKLAARPAARASTASPWPPARQAAQPVGRHRGGCAAIRRGTCRPSR